jgi:hypothetical protein
VNPYRDDNPSVPEHPAEVLFREAAEDGANAVAFARKGYDLAAGNWAQSAASRYHEALRASGECDRCGERLPEYDYIVGGERFAPCTNCHEPAAPDFEREWAKKWSA